MISELFAGRLLPGERILWSGQPQQGLLLVAQDIFAIPFTLMWCGFAIFWEVTVARSTGGLNFFTLWGLMFVLIGLYIAVGRFILDAWIRRGLHYAVTDRRILIARPSPFARFTALNVTQLYDVDLKERRNGRGTIRFEPPMRARGGRGRGIQSPAFDPTPQFLGIEDARRVFDLIQRAQAG